MQIIPWNPADRATFEKIGLEVSQGFAGEGEGKLFPKPLLEDVLQTIAATRAKTEGAGK
jgi:hypothetical protein